MTGVLYICGFAALATAALWSISGWLARDRSRPRPERVAGTPRYMLVIGVVLIAAGVVSQVVS